MSLDGGADKSALVSQNITLKGFFGTFEILVRDAETSEVQSSTVKKCPFTAPELICENFPSFYCENTLRSLFNTHSTKMRVSAVCSTDGKMTVVADLSAAVRSGGSPARASLVNKLCGPTDSDATRALFSFPLNSCGSTVKVGITFNT